MYLAFKHPCIVGVTTMDGTMSCWSFNLGDKVKIDHPAVVTLEGRSHRDFALEDGTVLLNVPMKSVWLEREYDADSVGRN